MIKLYDIKPIVGQSFVGVKRVTVPNQSMSLREIVRRFVRRESVPTLSQDGVYETRFGDLEKLKSADMFDQFEEAERLRGLVNDFDAREKKAAQEKAAQEKADADAKYKADVEAEVKRQTASKVAPA